MAREKTYVNKRKFLLLAIFLGGFGAQFFYAGKKKAGILCLIFCWCPIPLLIGWIQALIVYIFIDRDYRGNILI